MQVEPEKLKQAIIDFNYSTVEKINEIEEISKKRNVPLEDVLIEQKIITKDDLVRLEAYITGVPFINLEDERIPPDVLKIIPEPIARRYNIVAYRKRGRDLEVAMLNPKDLQTIEFIRKESNCRVLPRLTTPKSIKNALLQYGETLGVEFERIIKGRAEKVRPIKEEHISEEPEERLKKEAKEMPIIKIVDTLLRHAVIQKASDVHIEPVEKEIVVRYRIDGILHDIMTLPKKVHRGIVARIKVLSSLKLDEHRLPQDGRFKIELEGDKFSLRVSIFPIFFGEKVVMRLLPEGSGGHPLEERGLRGEALEKIYFNIRNPNGLILIVGPTGCGKTTTLYNIMDILNKPQVNIATVEDPIEYTIPRINQTQVRPEIGLSFANGLRALLRQDPDIIMVGEIRDKETAGLAVNAALTGHLVLSTLHTNSAAGAIPRLLNMDIEPFLIISTLRIVAAQRLIRKLCPGAQDYYLLPEEIESLSKRYNIEKILRVLKREKVVKENQDWSNIKFAKPKSSKACPEGYEDRMGIFEVLEISESIKQLILKGASESQIQNQAEKEGMITMLEDGFIKAVQRVTSIEEVLRVTRE